MQISMNTKTCATCKYYDGGACRVNPPTVHVVIGQGLQGAQPVPLSVWPSVRPVDWCGAYIMQVV